MEVLGAFEFLSPVDVKDFPDYLDIVKHPMDFSTIDKKLHTYKTFDEFAKDVELIFDNCRLYNPPEESYEVCALADGLRDYFLKACEVINVLFKEEDERIILMVIEAEAIVMLMFVEVVVVVVAAAELIAS